MTDRPTLFDAEDRRDPSHSFLLGGPGQARRSDPDTSHDAAELITARATSARVLLLEAFATFPDGLTDEEAAVHAGLSLASEYATRCSELTRKGVIEMTGVTRTGHAGIERVVRRATPIGLQIIRERGGA